MVKKVEMSLTDAIRGRVSRTNIVDPITDEVIVREKRTGSPVEIARRIEEMGLGENSGPQSNDL